jgi:HlyD family secretion protein
MKRTAIIITLLLLAAAAGGGGFIYWRDYLASQLPPGIVTSNGRIEANQVDVATKLAGRIAEIMPREGDMVERGAAVAKLDAGQYEAQLRQAQAQLDQAKKTLASARAAVISSTANLDFAQQQFDRTSTLVRKGYATNEQFDLRHQQLTLAQAALESANAQVEQVQATIAAAQAGVDQIQSVLNDTTIVSPIRGRVQYRLVEPGTVLAAGGRLLTLLDLSNVSMTIFLPATDAARLTIGSEARVVLDAAPDSVFPSTVSFVASEAQFTPKTVETAAEREKLMFRVKLTAPPELLKSFEDRVKSGLRGVAYVRVEKSAQWPARLAIKLPNG